MLNETTSVSNSITIRLKLKHRTGVLANALATIAKAGGSMGSIDIVKVDRNSITRDLSINASSIEHAKKIVDMLKTQAGLEVLHVSDRTFLIHLGGKIEVRSKIPIKTRDDLTMAYTPGVARICLAIKESPQVARNLTIKRNTVAIVTDGTAVLGLGDIGPEAALPVMEGKAMLFKDFGGVDAFPLCLNTKDADEIVNVVKAIAPTFGGINLEDISAPRCFGIEKRLEEELDIPVFHDDQHGTAVVLTAAFVNALKIVGKKAEDLKVVVAGVGAAGTACTKMLLDIGVKNIVGCDRKGILGPDRVNLNDAKRAYVEITNPDHEKGSIHDAMNGSDVFIGLSGPDVIGEEDLKKMKKDAIVFAMSNPVPEILPELAWPHVAIMATGRSDYPNQINNVLCFPGIFRGALDCGARDITQEMKISAAYAIAGCVPEEALTEDYIVPSVFNPSVSKAVAKAVANTFDKPFG